jgi:hypothetical protein
MQTNQSSVIERKGIYSNISEINKNKQYILYVLPLIYIYLYTQIYNIII